MQFHLNIGLARNDGRPDNTILHTVATLNRFGFLIVTADIQQSATEQTLCAAVKYTGRAPTAATHALAAELAQDCIAKAEIDWTGKITGQLVGPQRCEVGAFDSKFFLFPRHSEAA
ncbi:MULTISPECIES: hypothetical protein [Burkholderia]|uniref:hypothetical protein n=1 Tax=Burkholderia TaxID=32008 RepID=UPI0007527EFA|nr:MULTISPECIES: hypothetical protein [Burkholderia]AOJ69200.1 hypothetical protein WS78_10855 [Burkholderia savannae]KVG39839.1 hypothetical protein WS77_19405 [Burkholderia sp. MSMB0265]KVG85749.1 hypothetical protein WS81_31270 [Burkholderia sp. MSMB2040]KVG92235.1 hypothetical protein WS82_12380 [Burkholderia sp. MSMB2041]KVG95686.1 hypothetical protein WS83_03855 [Burkholderia sp. MSMB2042]